MAQYVSCKGHKPGCQGYRLAEILSKNVYASGKNPERSRRIAAHAASGSDSRMLLLQDRTKRRKNYINMTKYREIKK